MGIINISNFPRTEKKEDGYYKATLPCHYPYRKCEFKIRKKTRDKAGKPIFECGWKPQNRREILDCMRCDK